MQGNLLSVTHTHVPSPYIYVILTEQVMSEITQQVGGLIKEVRKARGLTQKELGEKLGVSESTVNKYENDSQNMTLNTLQRIAEAIGADLNVTITTKQ